MTSVLVKAILKGEEDNPLFLYKALMGDLIIKYSVKELLGSGVEVLEESKIGDVKLVRGEREMLVEEYLAFLNQTVRRDREISREVDQMIEAEFEEKPLFTGRGKLTFPVIDILNLKPVKKPVPSEVVTNRKLDPIVTELISIYEKAGLIRGSDKLYSLILYSLYKPNEFKKLVDGAYSQTMRQLDSISSLDKDNAKLVSKIRTVVSQLERQRKIIFSEINKVINELSLEDKEKEEDDSKIKDTKSAFDMTEKVVNNFEAGLSQFVKETVGKNPNRINKDYIKLLRSYSREKIELLSRFVKQTGSKPFNKWLKSSYVARGKWSPATYDVGNPQHVKIQEKMDSIINLLSGSNMEESVLGILRHAYDTNKSLRKIIPREAVSRVKRTVNPMISKMRRRIRRIEKMEKDLFDFLDRAILDREQMDIDVLANSIYRLDEKISNAYSSAQRKIDRELEILDNLTRQDSGARREGFTDEATGERRENVTVEEIGEARERTEEEEKLYQAFTRLRSELETKYTEYQERSAADFAQLETGFDLQDLLSRVEEGETIVLRDD